jgi:uncharacterized protein YmfQ (DUF2313 family)
MPTPLYSDADYLAMLQALAPRGRAWPRDPDALQTGTLAALAPTYTRNGARAAALISDAFPVAPVELLPEWEASLGLPDPCAGVSPTIQARQQQVAARFIAGGGQSIAFFVAFAATLGYPITITEFAPFRVGVSHAGDPAYGTAWAHAWQVNAPTFTIEYFQAGHDAAGEPLASWGNTVLQCELQRLAPAQTTLMFSYT